MKAVIVDIENKYAVALNKRGEFVKIRNDGRLCVGYEVEVPQHMGYGIKSFRKLASIAAVFLILTGLGIGTYAYNAPYAYIGIDINPSLELTVNVFERIIKAEGLNEDGERLASSVLRNSKNKKLEDGLEDIIYAAAAEGYFKPDDSNVVMVTVSGKDQKRAEEIQKEVENTVREELKAESIDTEIAVEKVTLEKYKSAKNTGISPGKLLLIEKLKEKMPELKIEDLKDMPVREIMKSIRGKSDSNDGSQKGNSGKEKVAQDNATNKENKGGNAKESVKEDTSYINTSADKAGKGSIKRYESENGEERKDFNLSKYRYNSEKDGSSGESGRDAADKPDNGDGTQMKDALQNKANRDDETGKDGNRDNKDVGAEDGKRNAEDEENKVDMRDNETDAEKNDKDIVKTENKDGQDDDTKKKDSSRPSDREEKGKNAAEGEQQR